MYFSLTAEKCVPVQNTVTMQPAFIVDMKGSVSVHAVEVLARSDGSCKFVVWTKGGMRGHTHTWMKPVMTKLQNVFVVLVNVDIFQMTLKLSLFTVEFYVLQHCEHILCMQICRMFADVCSVWTPFDLVSWYLLREKLTGSRMKFARNGKRINRN